MEIRRAYFDVTLTLRPGMPVYAGDAGPSFSEVMSISKGDICNLSHISFGSHTGTHIDAPRHFYDEGPGTDMLSPECFLGTARVLGLPGRQEITSEDLKVFNIGIGEIILLKTDNSNIINSGTFYKDYSYLTEDAAKFLADAGIRTLGFDYLSVDQFRSNLFSVHYILLGAGIPIIEGLDLSAVEPGAYGISALPLKIPDGNGSPARVILYKDL